MCRYSISFKELSPIKPLLCLENYKQKSIEAFLGIDREDKYSGGELINVYYEYLAQKDDEKLSLLFDTQLRGCPWHDKAP